MPQNISSVMNIADFDEPGIRISFKCRVIYDGSEEPVIGAKTINVCMIEKATKKVFRKFMGICMDGQKLMSMVILK